MIKKRIIPVILLRNGSIVQSRQFKRHQPIGTPTAAVERLSSWESDELIYLDISSGPEYDLRRDDLNHPAFSSIEEIITLVSSKCYMPLTFGGGIRSMHDVSIRIKNGADKITLNSLAIDDPKFITAVAEEYGSQCVVVSIDVKKEDNGRYKVYKRGKEPTDWDPMSFAQQCQNYGAGEILLNSIDQDGRGNGYDIDLINQVCEGLKIPLIALGGAGSWKHFEEVLLKTNVSAVAAANIFHHSENSVYSCKKYLFEQNLPVRKPGKLSNEKHNL